MTHTHYDQLIIDGRTLKIIEPTVMFYVKNDSIFVDKEVLTTTDLTNSTGFKFVGYVDRITKEWIQLNTGKEVIYLTDIYCFKGRLLETTFFNDSFSKRLCIEAVCGLTRCTANRIASEKAIEIITEDMSTDIEIIEGV